MDLREIPDGPFQRHPWEVARTRFFLRVLSKRRLLERAQVIVDVGAGDGWFASACAQRAPHARVIAWDPGYEQNPLRQPAPGVTHVQKRPSERCDLVLLLDVLEHVEDDGEFLADLVEKNLTQRGTALVSVPAQPFLYGPHDRRLGHHRRYRADELQRVCEQAGLSLLDRGGLFHGLVGPRWLENQLARLTGTSGKTDKAGDSLVWRHGPWLGRAVGLVLGLDNAVSRAGAAVGLSLPGLSTWMLCQKS